MTGMFKETYQVLVVDDSPDDCLLLRMAMRDGSRLKLVACLQDGDELAAYMKGLPPFDQRKEFPLPDAIIVDLRLPRRDGFDVLQWLSTQAATATVCVLTGSDIPHDLDKARALGAQIVATKNANIQETRSFLRALEQLLDTRRGPPGGRATPSG